MSEGFSFSANGCPGHFESGGNMEIVPFDATAQPDRFATCEEIREALSFIPDLSVQFRGDRLWEVPSDLGGHVLIESEDEKVLALLERLDPTAN